MLITLPDYVMRSPKERKNTYFCGKNALLAAYRLELQKQPTACSQEYEEVAHMSRWEFTTLAFKQIRKGVGFRTHRKITHLRLGLFLTGLRPADKRVFDMSLAFRLDLKFRKRKINRHQKLIRHVGEPITFKACEKT